MDQNISTLFGSLSDKTRLSILDQLATDGDTPATKFKAVAESSQSNVSQHLSVLTNSGYVTRRRRGTEILYSISSDGFTSVIERLNKYARASASQ